jgi:hypothetical protein
MIDIVIPFIEKGQQWHELRYTLRSIAMYCEDWVNDVWLIGDKPAWANVNHIPMKRRKNIKYNCWHDTRDKTIAVIEDERISEDYILWYDDIVCLEDISLDDIATHKAVCDLGKVDIDKRFGDTGGRYRQLLKNTVKRLQAESLPTWNYETHLPRLFHKGRMAEVLDYFNLRSEIAELPYMLPTCYYNYYFPEAQPESIAGFDTKWKMIARPAEQYESICKRAGTAKWLNYNNSSLSKCLKQYIPERFCEACEYEKGNDLWV